MRVAKAEKIATILDVKTARVYEMARLGMLPGVIRLGRQVRFDLDQVEEWARRGGTELEDGWRGSYTVRHVPLQGRDR